MGQTVRWFDIVWLRFDKNKPDIVQYKYSYNENEPFMELNMFVRQLKRPRRAAVKEIASLSSNYSLPLAYQQSLPLPVSASKKKDLLALCKDLTIPTRYHGFYENLTTAADLSSLQNQDEHDDSAEEDVDESADKNDESTDGCDSDNSESDLSK